MAYESSTYPSTCGYVSSLSPSESRVQVYSSSVTYPAITITAETSDESHGGSTETFNLILTPTINNDADYWQTDPV